MVIAVNAQRGLFSAEDRLIQIRQLQERTLSSFGRLFLIPVLILLSGAFFSIFLSYSKDREISKLMIFASLTIIMIALVVMVFMFVFWARRLRIQTRNAERRLLEEQKKFIGQWMANPTIQKVMELGFPRMAWPRETTTLGSTLAHTVEGDFALFELSYTTLGGYDLNVVKKEESFEPQAI